MTSPKADQIVTVRLPRGVADRLRAVTGVPISTLVRTVLVKLLASEEAKIRAGGQSQSQHIEHQIKDIVDEETAK